MSIGGLAGRRWADGFAAVELFDEDGLQRGLSNI